MRLLSSGCVYLVTEILMSSKFPAKIKKLNPIIGQPLYKRVPIVIFCAYFLTYFCAYRLLGGKDMAGKSHSRQKTAWEATKPLTFLPGWRETSTPNKK
jgi:hypothetical protein